MSGRDFSRARRQEGRGSRQRGHRGVCAAGGEGGGDSKTSAQKRTITVHEQLLPGKQTQCPWPGVQRPGCQLQRLALASEQGASAGIPRVPLAAKAWGHALPSLQSWFLSARSPGPLLCHHSLSFKCSAHAQQPPSCSLESFLSGAAGRVIWKPFSDEPLMTVPIRRWAGLTPSPRRVAVSFGGPSPLPWAPLTFTAGGGAEAFHEPLPVPPHGFPPLPFRVALGRPGQTSEPTLLLTTVPRPDPAQRPSRGITCLRFS